MRKLSIAFVLLMITVSVSADVNYSEYKFTGYTTIKGENTDLIKYEDVVLNRFYTLKEVNVEYREKNNKEVDGVYIDENDIKESSGISKYRPVENDYAHLTLIKTIELYETDKILIENLNIDINNTIDEIEVYIREKKIEYSTDIPELCDGILNNGLNENLDITLSLGENYNIEDIRIYFYYNQKDDSIITFDISYDTPSTKLIDSIELDNELDSEKKALIAVITKDDFDTYMPRYSILTWSEVNKYTHANAFVFYKTLYKHYELEKIYHITSEVKHIDGLIYDEKESFCGYKIMEREILEEKMDEGSHLEGGDDIIEEENDIDDDYGNENIENDVENEENLSTAITKPTTNESKSDVQSMSNNVASVGVNKNELSGPIDEEVITENNSPKEDTNSENTSIEKDICIVKDNLLIRYIVILLIMYIIVKVIHKVRVKFAH